MKQNGKPRVGCAGAGWIGLNRMQALAGSGLVDIVAVADTDAAARARALAVAPGTMAVESFSELLDLDLDGIVIATPSAQHAGQCLAALAGASAVFCQKPLARTAAEADAIVAAARARDRLLAVDFSYRWTAALQAVKRKVRDRTIGEVFGGEFVFHNAYGPDKAWFYDAARSGGGCFMDLGVHLVDGVLWVLDFPEVKSVRSALFASGERLQLGDPRVEDYAVVTIEIASGAVFTLTCSWRVSVGKDAHISARLLGSRGGVAFENQGGSFYDFVAESYAGTKTERLTEPPDDWGGRAIVEWGRALAAGTGYDPSAERFVEVARVVDAAYGRSRAAARAESRAAVAAAAGVST